MSYTIQDENLIQNENLLNILSALKNIETIDAIALGGSRAAGNDDKMSDYDLYVYCTDYIDYESRSNALLPYCSQTEICNHYWEDEDNCVMNNGIHVDIIYRQIEKFDSLMKMLFEEYRSFNGYTTCFWCNIITSEIIFDKSGKFTELQKKVNIPYPDELSKAIIFNNRKLLCGKLPSYDMQIKKAAERGDIVSVHHRITEFLASYFDIIFALNKVPHPGEKRLISLCKKSCKLLPYKFEENINALLSSVPNGNSYEIVTNMITELDKIL